MTSFQSSELTELPVVENSQLFAQRTVRHPRHTLCLRQDDKPIMSDCVQSDNHLQSGYQSDYSRCIQCAISKQRQCVSDWNEKENLEGC